MYLSSCRFGYPVSTSASPLVSPRERGGFAVVLAPVGAAFFTSACSARLEGERDSSAEYWRSELAQGPDPVANTAPVPRREPKAIERKRNAGFARIDPSLAAMAFTAMDRASNERANPSAEDIMVALAQGDYTKADRLLDETVARCEWTDKRTGARPAIVPNEIRLVYGKNEGGGFWARQNSEALKVLGALHQLLLQKRLAVLETHRLKWSVEKEARLEAEATDLLLQAQYVETRMVALRAKKWEARGGKKRGSRGR